MTVAEIYVCVMLTGIFAACGVVIALLFGKNRRDTEADARFGSFAKAWEEDAEDRRQTRAQLGFVTAHLMKQEPNGESQQKRKA